MKDYNPTLLIYKPSNVQCKIILFVAEASGIDVYDNLKMRILNNSNLTSDFHNIILKDSTLYGNGNSREEIDSKRTHNIEVSFIEFIKSMLNVNNKVLNATELKEILNLTINNL